VQLFLRAAKGYGYNYRAFALSNGAFLYVTSVKAKAKAKAKAWPAATLNYGFVRAIRLPFLWQAGSI